MKKFDTFDTDMIRAIDRSYDRNLPETCKYCAYGKLPSLYGVHCTASCSKYHHSAKAAQF